MDADSPGAGYELLHPIYLDVPMMVSFLAHLDGGVATHEQETTTATGAKERVLKARAGARARFLPFLDGEASGEGSSQRREEESRESKSERHHTAASLFNLLYEYLVEDTQLIQLNSDSQLDGLKPGQLVEARGQYLGNPLEDVLSLFGAMLPYVIEQQETAKAELAAKAEATRRAGSGSKNSQKTSPESMLTEVLQSALSMAQDAEYQLNIRLFLRVAEDSKKAPVHDLLIRASEDLQIVATVSSEYYTPETNEYLRSGEFRVVGKVTRVITGDMTVDLTRRTVLGPMSSSVKDNLKQLGKSDSSEGFNIEVPDPIVRAPAVQILPMAIFI